MKRDLRAGLLPIPSVGKTKNSTFFWQQVFIPAICVFIPALSNMKIANVHVGTIHRNVRIANIHVGTIP